MEATEDLVDGLARLRLSTEEASAGNKRKAYSRKNRKRREEEKTNNLHKFSQEDELRLAAAFDRGSDEEILATKFNIPIHRRDIRLLQPEEWLNDEVINYYMNLLQEHCDRQYNEWQTSKTASSSPSPQPTTANKTAPQRPRRKAKTKAQERMRMQQQQSARTKKRVAGAHNHDRDQHHEGDDDDKAEEEEVEKQEQEKKAEPEVKETETEERPLRCHFFNTFFYPLLAKGGHARVARWTRRVDLMAMDLVVVPVHTHGIHWTLATAAPAAGTIAHYDSIHQPNPTCFDRLRAYLLHEEKEKNEAKKKERSEEKKKNEERQDDGGDDEEGDDGEDKEEEEVERRWRMGNRAEECPRQTNGSDCGVFACMIARSCALGLPVSRVHQRDMPHYRRLMALEILNGAIIPSPPSSPPSSPRPTANVDIRASSSSSSS